MSKAITERQKDWLNHQQKAQTSGINLVQYPEASGIEPYRYLRKTFTELPKANSLEDVEALLPFEQNQRILIV